MHGDRARTSPLPVPAAPIAPAPEPASKHKQAVLSDGTVIEAWRKDGKLHRVDGPALVECYPDGTVIEQWYRNGKLHHEGGPAWVRRYPDGTVVERWYRNGKRHYEGGPAWVERSPDGTTESEAWYLDGKAVDAWQVLGRYLMIRGMPGLSAEALKQIAKDVPWQRWSELGSDHPLVALWATVHPSAEISAG